jgi:hypothetical protein
VEGAGASNGLRTLVTMLFSKPTKPVAGVATWAVVEAGTATVAVVSALLAVLATNEFVSGTVDFVTVADGCVTVAAASTPPTEVVGFDEAVGDDVVAGCAESDLVFTEVGVVGWVSGSEVNGGVLGCVGSDTRREPVALDSGSVSTSLVVVEGAGDIGVVEAPESVASVCAPPLLLTVTPDPTSVLDDVAPDVVEVPVAAVAPVPVSADVDPVVDVEPPPVVVAVDEAPVVDVAEVDDAAELVDDSEDEAPVSADANPNPYPVDTAATSQAATARPPYPPIRAALRIARVLVDGAVPGLLLTMARPFR